MAKHKAQRVWPTLRSGLLLSEAQLPKSGAGSGGGAASEGGVTGKLKGSAGRTHNGRGWARVGLWGWGWGLGAALTWGG